MKEILDGFWEMTKIASMQVMEFVAKKIDQMRKGIAKRGKERNKEKVKRQRKRKNSKSFVGDADSQLQEDSKIDEPICMENAAINPELAEFGDVIDSDGLPRTDFKSEKKEQVQPYEPNKQLELFFSDQNGLQISGIAQKHAGMNQQAGQEEEIDMEILFLLNEQDKMPMQPNNRQLERIEFINIQKEDEEEWWKKIVDGYREEDPPIEVTYPVRKQPLQAVSERESEDLEGSSVNPNDILIDEKDKRSKKMRKTKKIKHIYSFPTTNRNRLKIVSLIDLATDEDDPRFFEIPLCTKVYD